MDHRIHITIIFWVSNSKRVDVFKLHVTFMHRDIKRDQKRRMLVITCVVYSPLVKSHGIHYKLGFNSQLMEICIVWYTDGMEIR